MALRAPINTTCHALINLTCWDCRRDQPANAICTHGYFLSEPQPISGRFSFCSGHEVVNAQDMSRVAWMRLMCAKH